MFALTQPVTPPANPVRLGFLDLVLDALIHQFSNFQMDVDTENMFFGAVPANPIASGIHFTKTKTILVTKDKKVETGKADASKGKGKVNPKKVCLPACLFFYSLITASFPNSWNPSVPSWYAFATRIFDSLMSMPLLTKRPSRFFRRLLPPSILASALALAAFMLMIRTVTISPMVRSFLVRECFILFTNCIFSLRVDKALGLEVDTSVFQAGHEFVDNCPKLQVDNPEYLARREKEIKVELANCGHRVKHYLKLRQHFLADLEEIRQAWLIVDPVPDLMDGEGNTVIVRFYLFLFNSLWSPTLILGSLIL